MRVLLISPNRLRLVAPPLPLGLAGVAADVKLEHETQVLDLMFAEDPEAAVRQTVQEFKPDFICLSLRNIDNQDSRHSQTYFPEVKKLIRLIRDLTPAPVLVGGSGFSIMPRQLMAYLGADFGLIGEGEVNLRTFLRNWPGGGWRHCPGLIKQRDGAWQINPVRLLDSLVGLPSPALELFNPRLYHEAQGTAKLPGMIPVQSRRGCPMGCIYCTTPLLEGRRVRAWPPETVAARLAAWHEKWGLTRFYFVDSIFNHPLDYARRLCQAIKDLHLPLEWSCIINPAFPDPQLFQLIREAGGVRVQVGNESGSELVLRHLVKGFGLEQVKQTLNFLAAADLPYTCFLLLGGPGETPDSVQESVALLEAHKPLMVNLTVGVRIYPGLPLHRRALDEGLVQPGDELLWPRFYLAPQMRDWIWGYLEEVTERNPHWIF
ncbi:MAG: cobalamin-dependent protein [Deltaproteobacteria bacterium]|nr:cobalamin-dependent protein [Deltaproteobacteria bacterium]